MALLQGEGVAAGVVQDASNLASDPQLKARGFFIDLDHTELGKTISDAVPINLSDTPAGYSRAAPVSGQDNDHVYRELLGISEDELRTKFRTTSRLALDDEQADRLERTISEVEQLSDVRELTELLVPATGLPGGIQGGKTHE